MHPTMAFLASIYFHNILTSSDVYAVATANQMLQGKQYARGIRGVHLAHEALSHMFLTSAVAFATKNSLPWLTDETKQLVHDLEQSFKSKDATACDTICQKAEDMVLNTIALFRKEVKTTFSYIGLLG